MGGIKPFQDVETAYQSVLFIRSVWSIWFICFVWFNQAYETDRIDQTDKMNPTIRASLACPQSFLAAC